jgi:peptidyl-dipeptidase A
MEFYKLQNKKAREMGYKDLSEVWIEDFEDPNFEENYDDLYAQIKPLYEQLHAYVRRKLKTFYGKHYPSTHNDSLIPAHLLGQMWAKDWENIYNLVEPYPYAKKENLTHILIEKKFTPLKMFKVK